MTHNGIAASGSGQKLTPAKHLQMRRALLEHNGWKVSDDTPSSYRNGDMVVQFGA